MIAVKGLQAGGRIKEKMPMPTAQCTKVGPQEMNLPRWHGEMGEDDCGREKRRNWEVKAQNVYAKGERCSVVTPGKVVC